MEKTKINVKKTTALVLITILAVNLVLFAMKKINTVIFYAVLITAGLISYFGFRRKKN